jgi:purine-binding chemotaxis protein CheW
MKEQVVKAAEAKQYIVVRIGNERYGIDIQYVDNIVRLQRITRVPKAQPYFLGVINIRGEIIPIMSLRVRFDLEPDEFTNASRILIIKLEPQAAVGIIVDEVKNVIMLQESDVDKISGNQNDEKAIYMTGVGKHPEGLVTLLNLQGVIVDKETVEK